MSDDKFILDRVFAGEMRQLVFLLSSNNQPLNKSKHFFKKCFFNLHRFVEILCKPFVLPALDTNGKFKRESVVLALSASLRQNIIMFLQTYKNDFDYGEWVGYLQRNYAFLDAWSKVILGISNKNTVDSCLLSDDVKEELGILCCKFQHVKPFVNNEPCHQLRSPPTKRRRLPNLNENFFNDDDGINEDELVAVCDKTEIEFMNKSRSSVDTIEELKNKNQPQLSSPFIQQNITRIHLLIESVLDFQNQQLVQLFMDCPPQDFATLLAKLKVEDWDESVVSSFLEHIVRNEVLSFENEKLVILVTITSKLLEEQKSSVSRNLYQTIVQLLTFSKRLGLLGVLCECLIAENYQSCHTDLFKKLFTSETLNLHDINTLLENSILRKDSFWNEEFLTVLDYLVNKRSNLKESVKEMLIGKLAAIAGEFRNSLIMMKLVMSLIQAYQEECRGKFAYSIRTIVEQNETFLKKKVLKLFYFFLSFVLALLRWRGFNFAQ